MPQVSRLSSEQRDNLVAYLDGELAEEETRAIEEVLGRSEVARHEVEVLGRTWEMLEALPSAPASAEFAAKTLNRIKGQQKRRPSEAARWLPWGLLAAGWAAALFSAATVGFLVGQRWLPAEEAPYLQHLPVLRRLDEYRGAGNVEFLRELRQSNILRDSEGDSR